MNHSHDPIRQANYLRQCLAQEKRPLGLFLSGGCPMAIRVRIDGAEAPLVPGIEGLTKAIRERLALSPQKGPFQTVCSHFTADQRGEPTVEDLLTHIRSLRQVAGSDAVRGLKAADLDELDRVICDTIVDLVNKGLPGTDTPYHKVAAWIGAIPRSYPVEIFTPNYDLLIEQALEDNRVPYFDGFVGSYRAFFDPYAIEEDPLPPRWARLWKLHGSINWRQDGKGTVWRGERALGIERRVIHPSHLKYEESRQMPYLAMMDRLRAFLKRPSAVLVVCGYSFRDEHLNANLLQGLQGNPTAAVFALLYGALADSHPVAGLASTRANFTLLAEDGAIIGTRQGAWIEKEAAAADEASLAVEWVSNAAEGADDVRQGRFKLGDFARFGAFLGELIGIERREEQVRDAR